MTVRFRRAARFAVLACLLVRDPVSAREIEIDRIAAVVNTEPILLSEVQERVRTTDPSKGRLSLLQALNLIIDQKIEIQAAARKGISVSDNEIRQALDETRAKNGLTGEESFQKSLEKENLTLERVTEEIKVQLLVRKLFQREILQDIVVQEKELRDYYQNHSDLYRIREKREITQLLFDAPKEDDPSDRERIRKVAEQFAGRLNRGDSLDQLLKENPDDAYRIRSVELGTFEKGELLPRLDEAAFSTEPGKWTAPVETDLGFHLLMSRQNPAKYRPFETVSEEIREKLFQEKSEQAMSEWLSNLKKGATIELPLLQDPDFRDGTEGHTASRPAAP